MKASMCPGTAGRLNGKSEDVFLPRCTQVRPDSGVLPVSAIKKPGGLERQLVQ